MWFEQNSREFFRRKTLHDSSIEKKTKSVQCRDEESFIRYASLDDACEATAKQDKLMYFELSGVMNQGCSRRLEKRLRSGTRGSEKTF